MTAVTLAVHLTTDPFKRSSSELLLSPSFANPADWQWRRLPLPEQDGIAIIAARDAGLSPAILQDFGRPNGTHLAYVIEASTSDLVIGEPGKQVARCDAYQQPEGDARFEWFAPLLQIEQSIPRTHYAGVVRVPDRAGMLRVECELPGSTGTFQVHRVSMHGASVWWGFQALLAAGIAGWLLVAAGAALALWRSSGGWTLLVAVPACLLMLVPATLRDAIYGAVGLASPELPIDHFIAFTLVSAVYAGANRVFSLRQAVWALLGFGLFGIAVEVVQLYLPSRNAEPLDIAADVAGILVGFAIGAAITYRRGYTAG